MGSRIQGSPCFFSRENPECVEERLHCIPDGRSRSTPDGRSLSSRKENLYLGSFHVRFLFGRRLTVNVFRQRINQLFQGVGIFGGGLRSIPCGRLRSTPNGRSYSGNLPQLLLKGKI
ncbi:hypothetical protein [Cylindrospermopsis raciborskii]|uniref:hypothetical protein n=1 Tax=Cylindrospermopsis raciborskii TaxID=77022 RepID=UPI002ED94795